MPEQLNLVVALPAEAKPLIAHYRLKRLQSEHGFPVYQGAQVSLIVSGVGKVNSAAATAYLQAINHFQKDRIWVNAGIAGHARQAVGQLLLAHQVEDQASGRSWYPPLVIKPEINTEKLLTLDRPSDDYPASAMVDMEASGFIITAQRFSSSELVHCLKVISDNAEQPVGGLNAKRVQELMAADMPKTLDHLRRQLGTLVAELAGLGVPQQILQRFDQHCRFTVSQQHQLEGLLRRWLTLAPGGPCWLDEFAAIPQAKRLLSVLRQHVDGLPIRLTP